MLRQGRALRLAPLSRKVAGAVITNEAGGVAERLSYDAWGKRRNTDGTDDVANVLTSQTTRGFTGHEMIDEVDLVNMNGRVYDPVLGRFISADPFIHEVTNSQDLNRYSYVHNNPLSYTDMNGYGFFKSIGSFFKKFWKPLLAIAVAVVAAHFLPAILGFGNAGALAAGNLTFTQGAIVSGISGGLSNVVATGKPKAFLSGFGQAVATFGVGHGLFKGGAAFGSAKWAGKAVAHGVVGGAFAEIRGGSFKSGFLAAGFSSAAAPLGPQGTWSGAAFNAAVGGVGSVLGGGKFADGAVTGAFTFLFNHALEPKLPNFSKMTSEAKAAWLRENAPRLGIEIPDGVEIEVVDGYSDQYGNPCTDRLCGWTLDVPVYGYYLNGVIRLFTPAFERGYLTTYTDDADGNPVVRSSRYKLKGIEIAVHTLGHEAAHSRGIDLVPGLTYHPNAEAAGDRALQNLRSIYCGGRRC